jgi:hypothetical protein
MDAKIQAIRAILDNLEMNESEKIQSIDKIL